MSQLPQEAGYSGSYCQNTCDDCEYYRLVHGQRRNVLVITDQSRVQDSLVKLRSSADFNLEVTDCEYRCSMLIDSFRPDYVVIDCSLGSARSREFANLLNEDPRIPLVRVVLVGDRGQLPSECDKMVFALVEQQFTTDTLKSLVGIA
jgi:DNA-binding NtrC family response regulator